MRINYLFQLMYYFIITEIIGVVELAIWLLFRDFFRSLMNLENDIFGIKYAVPFILVVIPVISAIFEYQSKEKKISEALYGLFAR